VKSMSIKKLPPAPLLSESVLFLRIDKEQKKLFARAAARRKMTLSAWVRWACRGELMSEPWRMGQINVKVRGNSVILRNWDAERDGGWINGRCLRALEGDK